MDSENIQILLKSNININETCTVKVLTCTVRICAGDFTNEQRTRCLPAFLPDGKVARIFSGDSCGEPENPTLGRITCHIW
jgi:hypothetical protein